MGKEKKKQHFVPQCYLEKWAVPGKYQVYVYNKEQKKPYSASIEDVASERYFYDIDFTGIFTEDDLKKLGFAVCDPKHADDEQYVENYFSHQIEGDFKLRLESIINRARKMSPWEIKNCYFLSEVDKYNLSLHLALQYIRVRAVRKAIADADDCLRQVMADMGVPQQVADRYTVPESQFPYIHDTMILNSKNIEDMSRRFFALTWILQINRTSQPFFTSDSPIGTQAHIDHPFMSMAGLNSRGVEAYFPLSPDLLLLMFDGEYHSDLKNHDRRPVELNDGEIVRSVNQRCVAHSDCCVFSNTDNFSAIEEMLNENPAVLDQPRVTLQWGGNTYTPRRNRK